MDKVKKTFSSLFFSKKILLSLLFIFSLFLGLVIILKAVKKPVDVKEKKAAEKSKTFQTSPSNIKVNTAAIIFRGCSSQAPSELEAKIERIISQFPTVDLIVTPEYSLTKYVNLSCVKGNTPIFFDYQENEKKYILSSGQDGKWGVSTIKKVQNLAQVNKVNFILGTIAEGYENYLFNSQLIINHEGDIIGIRRKLYQFYPNDEEGLNIALSTVKKYTLKTHEENYFTAFSIICGERGNSKLLNKAANFNVDILANSEQEGDSFYDLITESIQNGTFDPSKYGWNWAIEDLFINKYINEKHIIRHKGFFVAAESYHSGVFQLHNPPNPIDSFSMTDDWVYGAITLPPQASPSPLPSPSPSSSPHPACKADINKDGVVNTLDLIILIFYWRTDNADADINNDGVVNALDLTVLILYWGTVTNEG